MTGSFRQMWLPLIGSAILGAGLGTVGTWLAIKVEVTRLGENLAIEVARVEVLVARKEVLVAREEVLAAEKEELAAEVEVLVAREEELAAEKEELAAEVEVLVAREEELAAEVEVLVAENEAEAKRLVEEFERAENERWKLLMEDFAKITAGEDVQRRPFTLKEDLKQFEEKLRQLSIQRERLIQRTR